MRRLFTTHVTTGIELPPSFEQQSHNLIPNLGKALFAGAAKLATTLARRELARVLRQIRVKSDQEMKRQATSWFVVEQLLAQLAVEATQALPAQAKSLARTRLRAEDGWGAFSVLGAWQLRECATTRVSLQDMPLGPTPAARKLSQKRPHVTRKTIQNLVNAYEATRKPPMGAIAEDQKNDPLKKLHDAVCRVIAKHQAAASKTFPSLVRTDIERHEWPKHSSFFLKLPFEPRLGLALSMLLRLRTDHTVWTHRLDFTIEPLLRSILREVRWRELARQLNGLPPADLAKLTETVRTTCAYVIIMQVVNGLTVGATSLTLPTELRADIHAAAEKHVQLTADEVLALAATGDAEAFDAASKALSDRWVAAIAGDLRQRTSPPENLEFVEACAKLPPNAADGDKMLNSLLASLPADLERLIVLAGENIATVGAAITAEVAMHFGAPPVWTVALPIANWSVMAQPAPSNTSSLVLMTIGELETTWKPGRELAPASPVSGGFRSELTKSSLCLVAEGICAPDAHLAVREARSRLDAILCGIWFLNAPKHRAQLSTVAFVHQARNGQVRSVGIDTTSLFPQRQVRPEELAPLVEVASALTTRWSEPHQHEMWRRVSEGMGFLRSAFSATLFYERYLFLWMALEALLNNLATDEDEKYSRAAPIGTRVAYRASLLLMPDSAMAGRTYSEARWATTLELGALYYLRNKAVHEGRRNPPMDEILLERFQGRVVSVFEAIAYNAFRYGMKRVEELLAWSENKFPDTNTIPST
jgi:hypothetical protein